MRAASIDFPQTGSFNRKLMVRATSRSLPELVGEIRDRGIVGVGAVVIERGDDVAARGQEFGEPGIVEAVAAAPVGKYDQRERRAFGCDLNIAVALEPVEERHDEG